MKILSKRHPARTQLLIIDELPFFGPMDITNWAPIHLVKLPVKPTLAQVIEQKRSQLKTAGVKFFTFEDYEKKLSE